MIQSRIGNLIKIQEKLPQKPLLTRDQIISWIKLTSLWSARGLLLINRCIAQVCVVDGMDLICIPLDPTHLSRSSCLIENDHDPNTIHQLCIVRGCNLLKWSTCHFWDSQVQTKRPTTPICTITFHCRRSQTYILKFLYHTDLILKCWLCPVWQSRIFRQGNGGPATLFNVFTEDRTDIPREAIGPEGSNCFSMGSYQYFLGNL